MLGKLSDTGENGFRPLTYLKLTMELVKAKQTVLLIYTGFFTYLISAHPLNYNPNIVFLLILSLLLAISGSTLLNMYIDRDIDSKMERTQSRPIPAGVISPSFILYSGIILSLSGVFIAYFINILTMTIIFMGIFFDVIMYSLFLKRRTKWSIVIGGIAGGLPALAGRTAVIGEIDIVGILFFFIILLWIPMHILTLATLPKNLKGYTNANIPMWPVVSGLKETRIVITISAILEGLLLIITGLFLNIHVIVQLPLLFMGFYMVYVSVGNLRSPSHERTFKIFKWASIFMSLIFMWLYLAILLTPLINNYIII